MGDPADRSATLILQWRYSGKDFSRPGIACTESRIARKPLHNRVSKGKVPQCALADSASTVAGLITITIGAAVDILLLSFNDVPLLLVIFQCLAFAVLSLVVDSGPPRANLFLALFLFAVGTDALDTLLYWSPSIKAHFFSDSVHVFFVLKGSVYLAAPALYFYVKAVIHIDYRFTRREALHFLPLAIWPFYLQLLYAGYGPEQLRASTRDYALLFNNPVFQLHIWARNLVYVGYCLASFQLLARHNERLKENYSNLERIDTAWLKLLVSGFLAIWAWVFMGYLLNLARAPAWLGDRLGVIGNFLSFVFVNALVFYSLAKSHVVGGLPTETAGAEREESPDQFAIDRLQQAMEQDECFLDSELTLEQLAGHTGLSARKISATLNRHFGQNFFDFVNHYRIERAKRILAASGGRASMLHVMAEAGFNSKSTFYRAFKKQLKQTPSEFCKAAGARTA